MQDQSWKNSLCWYCLFSPPSVLKIVLMPCLWCLLEWVVLYFNSYHGRKVFTFMDLSSSALQRKCLQLRNWTSQCMGEPSFYLILKRKFIFELWCFCWELSKFLLSTVIKYYLTSGFTSDQGHQISQIKNMRFPVKFEFQMANKRRVFIVLLNLVTYLQLYSSFSLSLVTQSVLVLLYFRKSLHNWVTIHAYLHIYQQVHTWHWFHMHCYFKHMCKLCEHHTIITYRKTSPCEIL